MIRVKVELLPHGIPARAEELDTIFITNDDTGTRGGKDEGGIGNYEVHDNETLGHLAVVDYPSMYACGFIKGLPRSKDHRLFLVEQAINAVICSRERKEQVTIDLNQPEIPDNLNIP